MAGRIGERKELQIGATVAAVIVGEDKTRC
jgi:hypothetical protein